MNKTEKKEENLHWADEKEVISSNKPLKFLLLLLNHIPSPIVHLLIFPVGLFYFLFSKRARTECQVYQKQLKTFTQGKIPKKISSYKQIVSFSLCVLERMEGWLGKYEYKDLITHDDSLPELIQQLDMQKGAILIGSHLGSIEFLRTLSCYDQTGVRKSIPVAAIMEIKATEQFTKTLNEINPKSTLNIIDPSEITPETIIQLQSLIENGGLVVFTADRTSANSRNRCIRQNFLGKKADFPYGVFLLTALLNAPTYFMFGLRTKSVTLFPKYNMFVEKSNVNFNCPRSEREEKIKDLCSEFVQKLEKYTVQFPYQWYNFYNFWLLNEE